jgi:hypothetical protein
VEGNETGIADGGKSNCYGDKVEGNKKQHPGQW